MVIKENIKDFNLDHIFDCGQCFRWKKENDGSYTGVAFSRPVNISFEPYEEGGFEGKLIIDNIDEEEYERHWRHYLDLDRDYGHIKQVLSAEDEMMTKAIEAGQGIRILQQDLWECILSFIISQNNKISRIKNCIEALCKKYGDPLGVYRGREYFDFPKPEVFAKLEAGNLADIRLGYRDGYIVKASRKIVQDREMVKLYEEQEKNGQIDDSMTEKPVCIDMLCDVSDQDALMYLTGLYGIGLKVANCILLFGLARHQCFPIDIWVRRVMNRCYGIDEKDMTAMGKYANEHFGQYGGIAQQYLFYYVRLLTLAEIEERKEKEAKEKEAEK